MNFIPQKSDGQANTNPLTKIGIFANVDQSPYRTATHLPKETVTMNVVIYLLDWLFENISDQAYKIFTTIGIIFGTLILALVK